jgi:predicted transposase YdaD
LYAGFSLQSFGCAKRISASIPCAPGGRQDIKQALTEDEKKEAMKKAVAWCIANNILRSFLETHGSEVVNMLMTEWKLEDALVVEREEGREEGLEKGREEDVRNLLEFGMTVEQISQALKLPPETVRQYSDSSR